MEELILFDNVELADGEKFSCDYLSTIPNGYMFIAIKDSDISQIVTAFTDKEKTKKIIYGNMTFEHYTVFVSVQQEAPGRFKVALRKAFAGEE